MSRTYTFNAIAIYGGRRAGINMMLEGFSSSDNTKVGWYKQGSTDYAGAVSLFFDSTSLLDIRSKAMDQHYRISSIKLNVNSSDTFAYSVPIIYSEKQNSLSNDWAVRDGYSTIQCPRYGKIPELTMFTDEGGSYAWDYVIPASCAYVLGGYYRTYSYVTVTSAVLTIVTNEVARTITYDANGGSNAPAPTVLWAEGRAYGNVTNDVPTRNGYRFVEWNTVRDGSGTGYASGASIDTNVDMTLYAQWEAKISTIDSAPDTDIGSTIVVRWTNYGNFVNKIKFVFGNIATNELGASGSSYSYTIPSSWYAQIPNAISGTATVYLYTYIDGVLLGIDSKTFSASVSSSIVPTIDNISASIVNEDPTVNSWGLYLQNYSKVLISVSGGAAGQGSSIVSYKFVGQNLNVTNQTDDSSSNATSDVIEVAGTMVYVVTITDGRGRTSTKNISIVVTPYNLPSISVVSAIRSNSDGTYNPVTGTSINVNASFSWSQVGSNTLTTSLSYKKHIDQSYILARNGIVSGTNYVIAVGLADIAFSYDVKVDIVDALNNSASYVVIVPPVIGIAFGLKNDRARFGAAVEESGLVCDWDVKLNGGNLILRDRLGNSATLTYSDLVALLALIQ